MKNITKIVKKAALFMTDCSSEIFTTVAIVGLFATIYETTKCTPNVAKVLEKAKEEGKSLKDPSVLKEAAIEALPAAVCAGVTGASIIGMYMSTERKYAALMATYLMDEEKLQSLEKKMREKLGDKKFQAAKDEIVQEKVTEMPLVDDMIVDTGKGHTLCQDSISGRYFLGDIEKIRQAQNDINEQIIGDWSATLNEWYMFLGLHPIKLGDDLGWNTNNMLKVVFTSALTSSGEPVLVLEYDVYPEYRLL